MTSTSTLGRLLSIYHGPPLRWRELVFGYIPATLLAVALLSVGLWRLFYGYTRYGPAAAIGWSRVWFLTSLFVTLTILIIAILRVNLSHRRIAIYEHGLVIYSFPLIQNTCYWTEVSGIAVRSERPRLFMVPLSTRVRAVIYFYHRRPIYLGEGYPHLERLIPGIKKRIYSRLMSNYIQDLNRGDWAHFGPLSLHQSELRIRSRKYELADVRALNVLAGNLVVELNNGRQQRIPVSQVPNLDLFFQLIKQWING